MTEPRLHLIARQALARLNLGHDPERVITESLGAAVNAWPLGGVYDQLPPRAQSICRALWGEKPLRVRDVHRIVGGSYHSIHEVMIRLMRAGYVRRVKFGHYAIQVPGLMPVVPKVITPSKKTPPSTPAQRLTRKLRRIERAGLL